ncbi:DUF6471 domain-containing protein [Cupriavidus sp. YR651]|uniref:DUF6471 domain-containing protein n=1 Tax=Cupriavidus sp. YR651 TaxID=1855315 RepID=UPI000B841EF7
MLLHCMRTSVSHQDTPWSRLASRTARGLLVRKGISYEQLVDLLAAEGVSESARGLEGKVQRGSFRCSFFLQLLLAARADVPPSLWAHAKGETWEDAAHKLFMQELSKQGLTFLQLSKRLGKIGVDIEPVSTERQVSNGSYPFTLLLQLSAVAPVVVLHRFVDQTDIEQAATVATKLRV